MAPRFRPGGAVYTKDGRRYIVDDVEDGLVYCSSAEGAETEFPEAQLMNDAEWNARFGSKKESLYSQLKQARIYTQAKAKIDRLGADQLLSKVERLSPGILDFVAFTVASRFMTESNNQDFIRELSIVKCREVFDAALPETRAGILAGFLGPSTDVLMSANALRDNLMRAMIDKGLAAMPMPIKGFKNGAGSKAFITTKTPYGPANNDSQRASNCQHLYQRCGTALAHSERWYRTHLARRQQYLAMARAQSFPHRWRPGK